MPTSCFSLTSTRNSYYKHSFKKAGLRSTTTIIQNNTTKLHTWTPKNPNKNLQNLLLLHGLGANAMWQWDYFIPKLLPHFNLYIPDLLFFGKSYTSEPYRTESFQAQCVMAVLQSLQVSKVSVAGISYGGFVAYSMARMFPENVDKVVNICGGVSLEEKDMEEGLFRVKNIDEAAHILLPQTSFKMRELLDLSFYKPIKFIPSCFLHDFIQVMCREYREERKQLIEALHKDRKLANLPKIDQKTLIIWGEHDQVFPLELAHRLKRHLGDSAQLVIIKKAGHAINMEKPKQLYKNMKAFLLDEPLPSISNRNSAK